MADRRAYIATLGMSTMPAANIANGTSHLTAGYWLRLLTMTKLMPLPYSWETADAQTASTPATLARRKAESVDPETLAIETSPQSEGSLRNIARLACLVKAGDDDHKREENRVVGGVYDH